MFPLFMDIIRPWRLLDTFWQLLYGNRRRIYYLKCHIEVYLAREYEVKALYTKVVEEKCTENIKNYAHNAKYLANV